MDTPHFSTIEDLRKSGSHLSLEERGITMIRSSNGWLKIFERIVSHWMPVLAMPNKTSYSHRSTNSMHQDALQHDMS